MVTDILKGLISVFLFKNIFELPKWLLYVFGIMAWLELLFFCFLLM